MKFKFRTIFILLLPFVLFFVFIFGREFYILNISKNSFIQAVKKARSGDIECLVIGDSHTNDLFGRGHVNCDSLAIGGTSIFMMDQLVRSVVRKNKLDKIILGIGPHYFSTYRRENKSDNFNNIAEYFKGDLNLLGSNPVIREMLPSVNSFFKKSKKRKKKKMWIDFTQEERIKSIADRIEKHTPPEDFLDSEFSKIYFTLVSDLIKSGVEVCIVRPPVTKAYQNEMDRVVNSNEWEELIQRLSSMKLKYVTFLGKYEGLEDKYFRNQDHISKDYSSMFGQKYFKHCFGE